MGCLFFCPIEFKDVCDVCPRADPCLIMPSHSGLPSKALCIKPKWADLILEGVKSVELRSTMTHVRGVIAVAHSGHLHGEVAIIDCFAVSDEWLQTNISLHSVEDLQILQAYKNVYAWVLKGNHRYDCPVRYKHPRGAIIWVNLKDVKEVGKQEPAPKKTGKLSLKGPRAKA